MKQVKDLVGLEMKPYTFEIEKGKIREFANAVGDRNPIYIDVEAAKSEGFEHIPIPLTFLTAVEFWGGDDFLETLEKYQVDPVRVFHGEQGYEFMKEIFVGDVLTVTSKVVDVVVKQGSTGGMDMITTEKRYVNQTNELVATSRSITIHRH